MMTIHEKKKIRKKKKEKRKIEMIMSAPNIPLPVPIITIPFFAKSSSVGIFSKWLVNDSHLSMNTAYCCLVFSTRSCLELGIIRCALLVFNLASALYKGFTRQYNIACESI